MTRWKETKYKHDDTLSGAYCSVCHWIYSIHEPTMEARCPFIPMFDDIATHDPATCPVDSGGPCTCIDPNPQSRL